MYSNFVWRSSDGSQNSDGSAQSPEGIKEVVAVLAAHLEGSGPIASARRSRARRGTPGAAVQFPPADQVEASDADPEPKVALDS